MKSLKQIQYYCLYFSLLIYIYPSVQIYAQHKESIQINKYNIGSGLKSNFICQMVQDQKGFIWIATEEGLNKFDGKSFTEFSTNPGRYSLSHNRTQAIMMAPDGNIWAGTSDGLNIYDYASDSIIQVKTTTTPLKMVYNDVTYLVMSPDNKKTWIGTYGNGVNYFNWNSNTFHRLKLPVLKGVNEPLLVMCLLEDANKRLWIGTQDNGLYKYNLNENKLEYCSLNDPKLSIKTIFQDSYKRLWIGTSKGCYMLNETTNKFDVIGYPTSLASNSINMVTEDKQGKIWIGTDLFLINFSSRVFSKSDKFDFNTFSHGESGYTLSCPHITYLLADKDNNMWIGTLWGGVNMLQGIKPKFTLYQHQAGMPKSIPSTPITGINSDKQGNLLLSTNTKGIYKMNLATGTFEPFVQGKYVGVDFQNILTDSDNNIWLGTFKNGLIKLNQRGEQLANIANNPTGKNSLPGNDVRFVYQTRNGNIYACTNKGFAIIHPKTNEILKVFDFWGNLGIRVVKEDDNGLIWIGTYGAGVLTYNPANDYIDYQPIASNLLKKRIIIVYDIAIKENKIWIATHGQGVFVYDKTKKTIRSYTEEDGLRSNFARSIVTDGTQIAWVGTAKGISSINTKNNEINNYNSEDGVQSQGMYERSSYVLPDGRFVFGGLNGLNIFEPKNVTKNDICPPVIFTKLSVFNQIISPATKDKLSSPINKNITIADEINISYSQSVFTLEFIGLDYNANQKIQYAYLLEGADSHWNYIGNQNNITFRNLTSGNYILKVKASSPDGVWGDEYNSIVIKIHPPFWKTWWAYTIYLIIIGFIIYFIWQFATIKIRTANEIKVERAKLEKEEELHQEKLQFFTNISHEFRTPLTLIIGPLEKMQADEPDLNKKNHIRLMLRNARRLLVMVNQLLDFRKAEKGQMQLSVRYADINAFITEILHAYTELKEAKNIRLQFEHEEKVLMTWFDHEFLDKCLFNLLSNAFKFTPENGKITVKALKRLNENGTAQILISVTDNGKGIPADELPLIFNQFYIGKETSKLQPGSGIGLHLTKNLVELHHGNISVKSTVNKFTTFTIEIPAEQSAYALTEFANENATNLKQIQEYFSENENQIYDNDTINADDQSKDKKRILLVEDNVEIRSYIIDVLGKNYSIDEAENGLEGLQKIHDKEYDLIITDLMMPELDGLEMCKQIKSSIETDHLPIIMLTAKSSVESRIEGLSIGADSYISKPFHPEHLSIRVSKLIEQRELFKARFSKKINIESVNQAQETTESPDEAFIRKAIETIIERIIETDFNGDALASELRISRMGLHRKIKALTGQSTGEFIRNIRLKKAGELLLLPGKNISDVCYEVGFNSPSYFSTCFTEVYKMTPTEYIKQNKAEN